MWLLQNIYNKCMNVVGYDFLLDGKSSSSTGISVNLGDNSKEDRMLINYLYNHTFNIDKSLIKQNVPYFLTLSECTLTDSAIIKKISIISESFNIVIQINHKVVLSYNLITKLRFLQSFGIELCISDYLGCEEDSRNHEDIIGNANYVKYRIKCDGSMKLTEELIAFQQCGIKIILNDMTRLGENNHDTSFGYWAIQGDDLSKPFKLCEKQQQSILLLPESYQKQDFGNLYEWLERR